MSGEQEPTGEPTGAPEAEVVPAAEPTATVEPPPATPTPEPRALRIAGVIDRWFVERIHNSPASRDVNVVNHLRAQVDDLKRRLSEEI